MTDKPPYDPIDNVTELLPGILKNAVEGQPGTANRTNTVGENEVATKLSHLTHGEISVSQLVVLMHKYGPPEVELAIKFALSRNAANKIANLGAFLASTLQGSWHKEKTSPAGQNRPSDTVRTLYAAPHSRSAHKDTSSGESSQENEIDRLRKLNSWTLDENRKFYLGFDLEHRQAIIDDVLNRWPWLFHWMNNWHKKTDVYSNAFTHHALFRQVSDVINCIRLDIVSRGLRSNVYVQ
jgi:hypothetical protein